MKKLFMLGALLTHFITSNSQKADFADYPVYTGNDLGLTFSNEKTEFKVWAPSAINAQVIIYDDAVNKERKSVVDMVKSQNGTWVATVNGNQKGKFYTYRVFVKNGKNEKPDWSNEVTDPYAKAVGINGKRAMVVDLSETNPDGWNKDRSPILNSKTDAIIYELHVRDASISPTSGIKNKGKFLGLTEKGTRNAEGFSTGLDHLTTLGVTHVHLLPSFDFYSIDETNPDNIYNWGYDPLNYNVPEGSYATNPYDGITRIKEFKTLVKTFHENGLRVIMDVVYNHTALTETSNFNQLVPGYYYRQSNDGSFSNASACGNETASERPMFRKFMLESVLYWVNEYHVDGFRFDLMGVHDIETMNIISKALHKIKPDILLYGEGWTAGNSPLPDSLKALKVNASKLDGIAVFSDDIRDGIKGSVFEEKDRGFVSGKPGMQETIKFGIAAACQHPQVDYSKVNYSKKPYAVNPSQTITYCECHDNNVLWDKLALSAKDASKEERKNMQQLALSIVLTSQGIPFLHAGTEFLRTKKGVENSYNSPDSINEIDWHLKSIHQDVFNYIKELIQLRKTHPVFKMNTGAAIQNNLVFDKMTEEGVLSYQLNGEAVGDEWKKVNVFFNGSANAKTIKLETGWLYRIKNNVFMDESSTIAVQEIQLAPYSCSILYQR